ncbi:MAG: ankyrin repeat domain-containing protein [Anaerolineae bacterium]|nr:ankyrin repeat domain-containing protein [Anaerolineae bacterium]MBL8105180.1 ankyrin repeat domain-containing protein [Anaerolineales bacterium]MCC7188270.1 ankyrin repeat domain-containing protein [Anaerolineales bacterium]
MRFSIEESQFFSSVKAGDVNAVILALHPEPYLVESRDEIGKTPLHLAVENGLVEMVKLLISAGAKVEAVDGNGTTALHLAIEQSLTNHAIERIVFTEIANFLLEAGADVNAYDKNGFSLLHNASVSGDKEIITFLVGKGADVNLRGTKGFTPLHWALCANIEERDIQNHLDAIETLISFGADVIAKTEDGKTPLIVLSENNPGRPQLAKLLKRFDAA